MKQTTLILAALSVALVTLANVVLTTPESVRSEIGGGATVTYEEIRTSSICVSPVGNTMSMQFELFDAQDAARPPFNGTYFVNADALVASLRIDGIGFETGKTLTAGQATAAINVINSHVDTVEGSMVSFGLVDGTQQ